MIAHNLTAAPALLMTIAAIIASFNPGRRGDAAKFVTQFFAVYTLGIASILIIRLVVVGAITSSVIGFDDIGLSFRIDAMSAPLLSLITFIGWVVVRYTTTYLDGEPREGWFMAWLCTALASVMIMVTAGNLVSLVFGWTGSSIALRQLLLFYPDRPGALRAARKHFFSMVLSDGALLIAALLLYFAHSTSDIASILEGVKLNGATSLDLAAAAMLAGAAILKSAQFPLHGWLTEVMEAPTPVSALLHAGIINAGGFVIIRFADLMLAAPAALAALAIIGGFSAILASMVMLTQPAVKTSLAWSTIAQMGFMLLQCGLGLFALALLHILAHSLYKAHAFLSSGGAVERIAASARPGPVAIANLGAVGRSFAAAVSIFIVVGLLFGFHHKSPQAIALGAILIFGVAYLFVQGFAGAAPRALTRRLIAYALLASVGYFALHALAIALTSTSLPATPAPDALGWVLIATAVISFGAVAFAQATFPLWSHHPAVAGLRVHLANGLYANALMDRSLGSWAKRRQRS